MTTLTSRLATATKALKSSLELRHPSPEVLMQQLHDLAEIGYQAQGTFSVNLLAKLHDALKDCTRGMMSNLERNEHPEVIELFLQLFPVNDHYVVEFMETIGRCGTLDIMEKRHLREELITNVTKHETLATYGRDAILNHSATINFIEASMDGYGDGGESAAVDRVFAGFFRTIAQTRYDGVNVLMRALSAKESGIGIAKLDGWKKLKAWLQVNEQFLVSCVMANGMSDYNSASSILHAQNSLGLPHLSAALNLRSSDPILKILVEGHSIYGLSVDESFVQGIGLTDGGTQRKFDHLTLECLLAYSLMIKPILPNPLEPKAASSLVASLCAAADIVTFEQYEGFDCKPNAQAVVDFVMERVTGKEDFSLIENTWLRPYAEKNLTYLKHAFTRDLGL
jgi:hypothetical protein